jgi:hypothetical protein
VRTFQRDRLIGTDEVHAEAVVESVLLDVRTGIVIHTAQATESISAKKTPGDLNFAQTIVKTQTEATGKALLKLAASVVTFAVRRNDALDRTARNCGGLFEPQGERRYRTSGFRGGLGGGTSPISLHIGSL